MRESEWKRLVTPLLPEGQAWHVQGRQLAYRIPVGRILFGVLAEGSAVKGRRYLWRLSMPLFEPSDTLNLSYSERVGGGSSGVEIEDEAAFASSVAEAVSALPSESTEMARLADLSPGPNLRVSESAVYANTYLGNIERATEILRSVDASTDQREWVGAIKERLQRFESLLHHEGHARAVEFLDAQAAETAATLGLVRG